MHLLHLVCGVANLGEKGGPDWLNIGDLGRGDESLELLGLCNSQFIVLLNGRILCATRYSKW